VSFTWQIPQVSKSLGVEIAADVTGRARTALGGPRRGIVADSLTTVDCLGWTNHTNKSMIYRIYGDR
jgi:hypothetical protein